MQDLVINPFRSQAQRAWMHANEPEMAERWEAHTPKGRRLPRRRRKTPTTNGRVARLDPSRTITLRRQFQRDLSVRFDALRREIVDLVVGEDALGLKSQVLVTHAEDETGKWITVKGNHIFIPEGKGVGEAIKEHFEGKKGRKAQTVEQQKVHVTKTPEFKRWFGESKVVDEKGEPLVVYHGTDKEWDAARGPVFVSPDSEYAENFGKSVKPLYVKSTQVLDLSDIPAEFETGGRFSDALSDAGIDVSDMKFYPDQEPHQHLTRHLGEIIGKASAVGYDSIRISEYYEGGGKTKSWLVFSPTQIKSAVGNKGTFDPDDPIITHSATANTRWQFHTAEQKVMAFLNWLKHKVVEHLVGEHLDEHAWWGRYILDGFRRGAARAFDDVRPEAKERMGWTKPLGWYQGTREEFLRSAFYHPVSKEKVQLLTSRTFTDLKGVTDGMASRISHALVDGLTRGENPRVIGRELAKQVDVSKARAQTIARTEIIRTHAEGQLDAFEHMGVTEVGVMAEWSTAEDARVCELCRPLDGVVMKTTEARGLLPRHPNCRCAWVPANVGEDESKQRRTRASIGRAIDESYRAEMPKRTKRTLEEQKKASPWGAADKNISKQRPKGVFNVGDEPGRWITVKGNHIFIQEGKDVGDAIKEHFEKTRKSSHEVGEKTTETGRRIDTHPAAEYKVRERVLADPVSARIELQKVFSRQYPDALPLFHESSVDNLDQILQDGLVSGESADETVFAAVGQPSGFVISSDKLLVKFSIRRREYGAVAPDMRYDPSNPAADLLREHSGVFGADVAYSGSVPLGEIDYVKVIRGGKIVKTYTYPFSGVENKHRPEGAFNADSYFSRCPRDKKGHCLPSGISRWMGGLPKHLTEGLEFEVRQTDRTTYSAGTIVIDPKTMKNLKTAKHDIMHELGHRWDGMLDKASRERAYEYAQRVNTPVIQQYERYAREGGYTDRDVVRLDRERFAEMIREYLQEGKHSKLVKSLKMRPPNPTGDASKAKAGDTIYLYGNAEMPRKISKVVKVGVEIGFRVEGEKRVFPARLVSVENKRRSFFADCERDEHGQCLPGSGTVTKGRKGKKTARARQHERGFLRAQQLALAKAEVLPEPTEEEAAKANERIDELGADRYESQIRGNVYDRARSRLRLLEEFGDGEHCQCVYCGSVLDEGTVTRDKIRTAREGGRYRQSNLVPACLACNQSRGDTAWEDIRWARKAEKIHNVKDKSKGKWVTIRGSHVFIEDGKITKGPKALIGRAPENLGKAEHDIPHHRPDVGSSGEYKTGGAYFKELLSAQRSRLKSIRGAKVMEHRRYWAEEKKRRGVTGATASTKKYTGTLEGTKLEGVYFGMSQSAEINEALRKGGKAAKPFLPLVEEFDEISSPLPEDVAVYKAIMPSTLFDSAEVGDVVVDNGFISTTLEQSYAGKYRPQVKTEGIYKQSEKGKAMVVEIRVPRGTKVILADSTVMSIKESELLLRPETKFKIVISRPLVMEVVQ